jgi:hypothetical protein
MPLNLNNHKPVLIHGNTNMVRIASQFFTVLLWLEESQRISEMQIRLVSSVSKPFQDTLRIRSFFCSHPFSQSLIPASIFPPHILSQQKRYRKHPTIAYNQSRQSLSWCLFCKEDIRTCDMACRVEDKPHPIRKRPLDVAGNIGNEEIPTENHWSTHEVLEPRATHERPSVIK